MLSERVESTKLKKVIKSQRQVEKCLNDQMIEIQNMWIQGFCWHIPVGYCKLSTTRGVCVYILDMRRFYVWALHGHDMLLVLSILSEIMVNVVSDWWNNHYCYFCRWLPNFSKEGVLRLFCGSGTFHSLPLGWPLFCQLLLPNMTQAQCLNLGLAPVNG